MAIHHASVRILALAARKMRGMKTDGATKLATARPVTICREEIGRTASCCGSRFSSSGKMITGRVTQMRKAKRAAQPR